MFKLEQRLLTTIGRASKLLIDGHTFSHRSLRAGRNVHTSSSCIRAAYSNYTTGSDRRSSVSKLDTGTKRNIILMGSPGCGKTTIGRLLATKLNRNAIDIDDDLLEPHWGMPVAQKLDEVGSDGFIQAEGEALKTFNTRNVIVSLTGSNPMHADGMNHVSKTGVVVFLDVHIEDILERLMQMKVNRIVGQNDGSSMSDILKYRQQFYELTYDVRVICERNETPQSVADKIIIQMKRIDGGYISTRQNKKDVSVKENVPNTTLNNVILQGLAPDGGLYVPRQLDSPCITHSELKRLVDLKYSEKAVRILEKWIDHSDVHPRQLKQYINNAYTAETFGSSEIFPVRPLANNSNTNQYILELFHGPTASFKDAALQLMPQLFSHALRESGDSKKYMIVVATSGDTGGAVLDGFIRRTQKCSIGVVVFYPSDGVSEIQRQQMLSLENSHARVIGVTGADFDLCQRTVKRILNDVELSETMEKDHHLKISAANSISWGRLLPQIVYHVTSYLELVNMGVISVGDPVDLCVPTGNFGNLLAAYFAKKMGIQYKRLICASNSNNVLTDFFQSGTYDLTNRTLELTSSPAIDILVSSNLERLLYDVSGGNAGLVRQCFNQLLDSQRFTIPERIHEQIKEIFIADWCSEAECRETVRHTLKHKNYLLDTHTAVAKSVADRYMEDRPMLIASTAHPAKFAHDILAFLDIDNIESMESAEMLVSLESLSMYPRRHALLHDCLKKKNNVRRMCGSSYKEIVGEIKTFASMI